MPNYIEYVNLKGTTYNVHDVEAEDIANKVSAFDENPTNTQYPSALLVRNQLNLKENAANKLTTFSGQSPNDTQYPSAKLVKDELDAVRAAIASGIEDIDFTPYEVKENKIDAFGENPTATQYPSARLVKASLDALDSDLTADIQAIRTVVVDILPSLENAVETVNYILKSGDGGLLYKKVNGAWRLVGGSKVMICDTELPASGDSFTDYYVPADASKAVYLHYRWMDAYEDNGTTVAAHFFAVGADAYSKAEADTLFADKEDVANKVQAFSASPTNTQYPTAKLVYDSLQVLQDTLEGELDDSIQEVTTVPDAAVAEDGVFYIVKQGSGALLYRKIEGTMRMIGGAMVQVVSELPEDSQGNPAGDAFTDYYVPADETGEVYLHYRWMDEYTDNGTTVPAHFYAVGEDAYSKSWIDAALSGIRSDHSSDVSDLNTQIGQLSRAVETNASAIEDLEGAQKEYSATLTQDGDNYVFSLIENETDVVSSFTLPATGGGGGGGGSSTTMSVERITQTPVTVTPTDDVIIQVNFSDVDGDNETVDADYVLKMGTTVVMSGAMSQGLNSFNVTNYCTVGTQKFTLTVTDAAGSVNVKTWTVQVVDVRLESSFSDRNTNAAGRVVNFTYTPYGSISKVVHFKLDGTELPSVTTSVSGILQSYSIPAQSHGAHLLECWITASVNGQALETSHIYKDIIWFDDTSDDPVIGCIYRYDYYGIYETRQYNTTNIPYVVYDPSYTNPTVELKVDGVLVSEAHLTAAFNTWSYKSEQVAMHTLTISCRGTTVTMRFNITELGYDIEPVTANLNFDFNPTGITNASANRLWTDANNTDVHLTVSENFDWENGGYQVDSDGNQYFLVKSGTRAYISHNLFGTDPKQDGAEFKVIFMTQNVRDKDAVFLTCLPPDTENKVGLEMKVHEANVYTSTDELNTQYSEEDIIEFEYNINALNSEITDATSFIMSYEDGVAARPLMFDDAHRIYQYNAAPITIGSDDCDVLIYRMKSYSSALTDSNILANFIADARDSETMIARYERNQIYNENNELTPESVAAACPDLKVIKISCPHFTTSKTDFVKYTNVECVHINGDPVLDNWTYTNGYHAGQGTTSNAYGLAGRNIDIIFGFDGEKSVIVPSSKNNYTFDPTYVTTLTLGDGTRYTDGSGKVDLTRNSVPNDWFNIKVNIASSENANNALLQKRYNDYIPYKTPGQKRDPKKKNSMEFVNCVIFVQERDADLTTHTEFPDTEWHFYAIGNLGDSKKTDNTRVNDPEDPKEFVVEISDNTLPNSYFDTGVYLDANGSLTYDPTQMASIVYPITQAQWNNANNLKRQSLYDAWDDSFEFRYDMGSKDGETISGEISEAQQAESKQVFRNMYEFVIMSSDTDFVNNLGNWFIVESPLYWYLFTERYTMVDNRAKNSFWHWGRVYISTATAAAWQAAYDEDPVTNQYKNPAHYTIDDAAAAINNGYRFDLWDYDDDSALGIDNNGELKMTYGKEDIDYKNDGEPSSGWIFNAADSVFWRRIRGLMNSQLRAMYNSRESLNCWTASSLITEFDAWQEQFPEELWRLDIERKYLRPYYTGNPVQGLSPTARFLKDMMNGRKRYQRRQFERNQEIYIGTKYFGINQCSDSTAINFRCNTPQNAVVRPDYTVRVVPYSDMYLWVAYGNSTPQGVRAKAGQEYTFTTSMTTMDDTVILVYCAENIQALNDLSACYIRANNFAYAKRLKVLIIGSTVNGYSNPFITALNMGNNALLETLDVRNCPNLTGSINLTACGNLETFYAEGTSISAVSFATNGKLRTAHLPATIASLTLRYLNYLTDLTLAGYGNLETLVSEYCNLDPYPILMAAINTLQNVRILGIAWTTSDTSWVNKIYAMSSSVLAGSLDVDGYIRRSEIQNYLAAWPGLDLTWDEERVVAQHTVTYANYDGTVLGTTLVDQGSTPPDDPVGKGIITALPTRDPDDQYQYTFSTWDGISDIVYADTTVTAVYSTELRTYTVKWYLHRGDMTPLCTKTVQYGSEAIYESPVNGFGNETYPITEIYEVTNNVYRLFKGWDKSTGSVKSDLSVYAQFDECYYPADTKDLRNFSAAEVFAVSQARKSSARFDVGDYVEIKLGYDPNFEDPNPNEDGSYHPGFVKQQPILENRWFDGNTYLETDVKPFKDGESFTIAIDYEFFLGNNSQATLASCMKVSTTEGFVLNFTKSSSVESSYSNVVWRNANRKAGTSGNRNIVVIRYKKGDTTIRMYSANGASSGSTAYLYDQEIVVADLVPQAQSGLVVAPFTHDEPLVFGAYRRQGASTVAYDRYAKGWIHWAKIWYDDLGDDVCRKIANWPRETYRAEYVGSQRHFRSVDDYNLVDSSWMFTCPLTHHKRYDGTSVSTWGGSELQRFYENRVYAAFPQEWQTAIGAVAVATKANNNTINLNRVNCHCYLPAFAEIYQDPTSNSYYTAEMETGAAYLSSFVSNYRRYMLPGVILERRAADTAGRRYWLQSNDPSENTQVVEGDLWIRSGSYYTAYVFVSSETMAKHSYFGNKMINNGSDSGGSDTLIPYNPNNSPGLWVRVCELWTRSPYLNSSTGYFVYLYNYYASINYSNSAYSNTRALLVGFSI